MALTSPRFVNNVRLQQASENAPPMKWPEKGEGVAVLQQAFIDLGFPMPGSTSKGLPDGVFGSETLTTVMAFQTKHALGTDGVVGKKTMSKLDELFPGVPRAKSINYEVPGLKPVIEQPSPSSCWATAYCIMRSWRDNRSYGVREAVGLAGERWAKEFDKSYPPTKQGLLHKDVRAFFRDAKVAYLPMINLPKEEWLNLLKTYGLLWIGAATEVNVDRGFHARVIEGMHSSLSFGTSMKIIDPGWGRRYSEPFSVFQAKYELGTINSGKQEYIQVGYFEY